MSVNKGGVVKTASDAVVANRDILALATEEGFDLIEGFSPRTGHIYTVTRAISARINQNYDGFPSEELKKAYITFLGKPVFVNHVNDDPTKARGRVVGARYVENGEDKYIEVIQEVNANKFPLLAKELRDAGLDSVSMGCSAERTICSFCGNEASGMFDMCAHVLNSKGRKLRRQGANGEMEDVLVYEECRDLGFFELSYVFDPADETAMVSNVVVASRNASRGSLNRIYCDLPGCNRWTLFGSERYEQQWIGGGGELRPHDYCCDDHRQQYEKMFPSWKMESVVQNPVKFHALQHQAFGEIEAPPAVDTLRDEGEEETEDFHQYVESPDILSDPNLDKAKELDRREDLPEGFEDYADMFLPDDPAMANPMMDPMADPRIAPPGAPVPPPPPPGPPAGPPPPGPPGGPPPPGGPAPTGPGGPSMPPGGAPKPPAGPPPGGPKPPAPGGPPPGGPTAPPKPPAAPGAPKPPGDAAPAAPKPPGGAPPAPPKQDGPPAPKQDAPPAPPKQDGPPAPPKPPAAPEKKAPEQGPPSSPSEKKPAPDKDAPPPAQDKADKPSEDKSPPPSKDESPSKQPGQVDDSDSGGHDDENDSGGSLAEQLGIDEDELVNLSPEDLLRLLDADDNEEKKPMTAPVKAQKGNTMSGMSPATRGRTASRGRVADQSRNDQGEKEDTFITQTPPAEPVETGEGEEITNTEENLVATILEKQAELARVREAKQRKLAEEETADKVDPPLSGTDEQDLKGDFESADPNEGVEETQPKDASRQATLDKRRYRRFASWVQKTSGKSIKQANSVGELRSWVLGFSREANVAPEALYPIVRADVLALRKRADRVDVNEVRDKIEKGASDDDMPDFIKEKVDGDDDSDDSDDKKESHKTAQRRKVADEKLDVAAPDGRVDVEAPVADTTDDEAQASQYDKGDFGDNAGDDKAEPDLSTDQNWAPGEGKQSSRDKFATGVQACRLARAYIDAGLEPASEEWNLAAQFESMKRATVVDRLALLERVIQTRPRTTTARKTAGNRGSRAAQLPQNLTQATAPAAQQQFTAAAGESSTDSDIFL